MSYKTMLVHLDDADNAQALLHFATDLAERHQAHLTGLYVTPPVQTYIYSEMPMPAVVEDYHYSSHSALAEKLSELFHEITRGRTCVAEWRHAETPPLPVISTVSELAHTADLLIVGQDKTADGHNAIDPTLSSLVLGTGRPVLVVPGVAELPPVSRVVLVAWDGGHESTRAVFDSLPLLQAAEKVIVHRINPGRFERHHLLGTPSELVTTLSRHGVAAMLSHSDCSAADVGGELLQTAFEQGAQLMVMGAYGKHRFRDLMIGSTTRSVLSSMHIPVLMSH